MKKPDFSVQGSSLTWCHFGMHVFCFQLESRYGKTISLVCDKHLKSFV